MSSPIELIGSSLGTFAGIVYQFTATINSLSGDGALLPKAVGTVLVLYISYRILKQMWGLLVFLFKLLVLSLVAMLALRAYELGFDGSVEAVKQYAAYLYDASQSIFDNYKHVLKAFDKYMESTAHETWHQLKVRANLATN